MLALIGADYPKCVIPLIDDAKKNIDIVVFDWRWYEGQLGHPVQQFNMAIVRARLRGVQVRALCHNRDMVKLLGNLGIAARALKDKRTLHAKMIIIDKEILVIGSHNFTRNAFGSNVEISVVVDIPVGYDRFSTVFNNLYGL